MSSIYVEIIKSVNKTSFFTNWILKKIKQIYKCKLKEQVMSFKWKLVQKKLIQMETHPDSLKLIQTEHIQIETHPKETRPNGYSSKRKFVQK